MTKKRFAWNLLGILCVVALLTSGALPLGGWALRR